MKKEVLTELNIKEENIESAVNEKSYFLILNNLGPVGIQNKYIVILG